MARRARAIHRGICRGRVYQAALFVVLISASAIVSSEAQTITTWSSSSLSGTFNWSTGLTGLSEGGEMSCTQQSLYYGIGGGTVYPLPTANSASITVSGHGTMSEHTLTTYYSIPDIGTLSWAIGLDGNTWGETMQFWNNSGSSANLSLFQYSYFVLGSAPGSQTLGITQPFQDEANFTQSGGGYYLTLNAQNATGTTEVQADNSGAPFGPFNGIGTALNNAPVNGTGTVDFGVEFDANNVANGAALAPQETATDPALVPEPASVALVASGMALLALVFRRRLVCASDRHA